MRIFIRKILSQILDKEKKDKIKKIEYKTKKKIINALPSLDENKLRDIFKNKLNIQEGDNLFIHASLDMLNTSLSPLQILNILLDIVGENGSISAPTFIRYSSKEWMLMEKPFNAKRTPSGMGLFSERVRRHKLSKRSLHPTKSVASIGPIAEEVTNEHHLSKYPFGTKSPFYKLLDHDVKIIGLGAPMSYLSMVHVVEDIHPDTYPIKINEPKIYEKTCVTLDQENIQVRTYAHDLSVLVKANPEKFIKKYMNPKQYKIYKYFLTPFFVVDGSKLLDQLTVEMLNGNTIYD